MTNYYNTVFYIGVTNNLEKRVGEHKFLSIPGFTQKYNITKLIYFEESQSRNDAIAREKQLKGWSRIKKLSLIKNMNPTCLSYGYNKKILRLRFAAHTPLRMTQSYHIKKSFRL